LYFTQHRGEAETAFSSTGQGFDQKFAEITAAE
jgi:hypothetical protein